MVLVDLYTGTVVVILSYVSERMFIADSVGNVAIAKRTSIEYIVIPMDDDDLMDMLAYATNEWLDLCC